jgi:hypothetical protein
VEINPIRWKPNRPRTVYRVNVIAGGRVFKLMVRYVGPRKIWEGVLNGRVIGQDKYRYQAVIVQLEQLVKEISGCPTIKMETPPIILDKRFG